MMLEKYIYASLTWPEVNEAVAADRLVIMPTGMTEQHGPHLPLDVDVRLCTEVCHRAAERLAGEALVTPPVSFGYAPHQMDFPGSLGVDAQAFVDYTLGVTMSLVHHGFRHILLVNGHGSNWPFVETVARLTIVRSEGKAMCAALNYWGLGRVRAAAQRVLESGEPVPSHAGEFETSLYLAVNPEGVNMAAAGRGWPGDEPIGTDYLAGPDGDMVAYVPFWSTMYKVGIKGDATKGTREKGEVLLEAAVSGLAELARRFRAMPLPARVDHH
ncbi:MAG: creatininase family protein [Bacteroidetes bacterium]|nr:creatininase family protein [Bacteroidota bacterium]MCL5026781.1 creatininase family protein [Chloroflexota bacterium]